jgi:hypothetical protein
VPARLWKATLDDVLADIKANRTAAKQAVIHNLYRRQLNDVEREAKLDLLRHDGWFGEPLLRRLMRRHWKRGKTAVDTHIVLDTQCYGVRKDAKSKTWLDVMGLTPKQRLTIPLASTAPISGTIRLILRGRNTQGKGRGQEARGGRLEIHHAVLEDETCVTRPCGSRAVGADKGFTEVFTDSDDIDRIMAMSDLEVGCRPSSKSSRRERCSSTLSATDAPGRRAPRRALECLIGV